MDVVMSIAKQHNLFVVEDAAQAICSYYKGKPLGSIGHLACFSFHETKNIQCGEGGMLVVNDEKFSARAEIIWEKGTNRASFFRGEIDKYGWVDTGSSFLISDLLAAFLFAQIKKIEEIQTKRVSLWNAYRNAIESIGKSKDISLPIIPSYATNNAHMFYLLCKTETIREKIISHLKKQGIQAVFHYQNLAASQFGKAVSTIITHQSQTEYFAERLLRLPIFVQLDIEDATQIVFEIERCLSDDNP
jgi:dTDP-4-amino-4,6-dideoxygalactose transaminase